MTEPKNTTIEKMTEARRQFEALQGRYAEFEREIVKAEDRLSDGFQAVADGDDVPTEVHQELANLLAKKMALKSMLTKAEAVCETAKRRVFARGVMEISARMRGLVARRNELAAQAAKNLDVVAEVLWALIQNGEEMMGTFRGLRGTNMQTDKGVIAWDIGALGTGEHLQHLLQLHMTRRVKGWRYANTPPYGGPTFDVGVRDANAALLGEWNQLMGLDALLRDDVAAVNADMAAEGGSPQSLMGQRALGGETDVEALLLTLPDLDVPHNSQQGG